MDIQLTLLEFVTLTLSVVALVVTVLGFFASLKFYRDGVEMTAQSRDALAKIEERASNIQTQVGGMFNKTLEALIGNSGSPGSARTQGALSEPPVATASRGDEESRKELPSPSPEETLVSKYFFYRGMRLTAIDDSDNRAIFDLGKGGGFNLFDGPVEIEFFGLFQSFDSGDVVARVRMLFNALQLAYRRLAEHPNKDEAAAARAVLSRIAVSVLVATGTDLAALKTRIEEFQPPSHPVRTTVFDVPALEEAVQGAYRRLAV